MKTLPVYVQLLLGLLLLVPGLARSPWWLHEAVGSNWWLLLIAAALAVLVFRAAEPVEAVFRLAVFSSAKAVFFGTLFLLGTLLYTAVALWLFDGMPRIPEGAAALFQSKIFADGKLWAEAGALHDVFGNPGMIHPAGHETAYVTMYPPAWPAVLALGSFFDLAWLVNPLLGGGLVCAVGLLGTEIHDERSGRIAALLALVSPMFLVLNGSYLGHTLPALCLVLCAWATIRLVRGGTGKGGVGFGVLAGLMVALVFLCRPASGLPVALCIAVIPLCAFAGWRRFGKGALAAFVCALVGVLGLMAWQQMVSGDWRTTGHEMSGGENAQLSFDELGEQDGQSTFGLVGVVEPKAFDPAQAMTNSRDRLGAGDDRLLGWPISGCLLLAALFLLRRGTWWDAWCILPAASLLVLFHVVFRDETFFPARYLAEGVPFLFVPLARVFFIPLPAQRRWFVAGVAACAFFALTVALPFQCARFTPVHGDYIPHVVEMEERYDLSHSVVFVTAPTIWPNKEIVPDLMRERHGFYCPYYTAGFVRNRPDFNGDVVYVRHGVDLLALETETTQAERAELGVQRNLEVMEHFAGRRVFVLEFHRQNNRAKYYQVWPTADFQGFDKVVELP